MFGQVQVEGGHQPATEGEGLLGIINPGVDEQAVGFSGSGPAGSGGTSSSAVVALSDVEVDSGEADDGAELQP